MDAQRTGAGEIRPLRIAAGVAALAALAAAGIWLRDHPRTPSAAAPETPSVPLDEAEAARRELVSGDLQRAVELYEKRVRRSPEPTELTNLGTAYLITGRYADAAQRFREALALAPGAPTVLLRLGDAELLAGRRDEASELYRQVLEQTDHTPSPETLFAVRAQALAHLDRRREAVVAVMEAQRQDPDSPHRSYEAAVVYALVGEDVSALVNAVRALEQGLHPHWFALPWFDPIRSELARYFPTS